MPVQVPTVGTVVYYYPLSGEPFYADAPLTAVITYVWSNTVVNLEIFDPNGRPIENPPQSVTLVQFGDAAPTTYHYAIFPLALMASHDYAAAHADWTLSATEQMANVLVATNAAGAGANIVLSAAIPGKIYKVDNGSGQTLTFKVAGQSGGTVATGKVKDFYCNATDIVAGQTT